MINIERILCPTDLSTESDEALRYAVALARAYEAKLILLYCRDPSSSAEWANGARAQALVSQSLFTHLGAAHWKQLDWKSVVTQSDDVGCAIADEAAIRKVDLIVMRSRRRPHAAALLGSTAEAVCRTAPCPVLVTHPREREWVGMTTGQIDLHRLLVPYDASSDADVALNYGLSLAQQYQAEIHLLHVIGNMEPAEPEVVSPHGDTDGSYNIAARHLQRAIPQEAFLWCNFVAAVRYGQPADEILTYAKEHNVDLICMGASGAGFLGALLGSTVDRVLRRAPCPVFVARPVKSVEVTPENHKAEVHAMAQGSNG